MNFFFNLTNFGKLAKFQNHQILFKILYSDEVRFQDQEYINFF